MSPARVQRCKPNKKPSGPAQTVLKVPGADGLSPEHSERLLVQEVAGRIFSDMAAWPENNVCTAPIVPFGLRANTLPTAYRLAIQSFPWLAFAAICSPTTPPAHHRSPVPANAKVRVAPRKSFSSISQRPCEKPQRSAVVLDITEGNPRSQRYIAVKTLAQKFPKSMRLALAADMIYDSRRAVPLCRLVQCNRSGGPESHPPKLLAEPTGSQKNRGRIRMGQNGGQPSENPPPGTCQNVTCRLPGRGCLKSLARGKTFGFPSIGQKATVPPARHPIT